MDIEFRILENSKKEGVFTLKIENEQLAFNHSLIHKKDVFEDFNLSDFGIVNVKGIDVYHINGQIITPKEFRFVSNVIKDLEF